MVTDPKNLFLWGKTFRINCGFLFDEKSMKTKGFLPGVYPADTVVISFSKLISMQFRAEHGG